MPTELITYEQNFSSGVDAENDYPPLDSGMGSFQVSELERQGDSHKRSNDEISELRDETLNGREKKLRQSESISRNSTGNAQVEAIPHHSINVDQSDNLLSEQENPTKVYLYDDPHLENDPQQRQEESDANGIMEKLTDDNSMKQVSNAKTSLETAQFLETSNSMELQRTKPHDMNIISPSEPLEQPFYVNAKQYYRILKRRYARAKLEENLKISRERRPYLHESRHKHAMRRPRGQGGRFLTAAEMAEMKRKEEEGTDNDSFLQEHVPKMNVLPQQLPGPVKDNNNEKSDEKPVAKEASF